MSFADLIRAREAQQRKLRGELEAQNQALRDRLGLISNTLGSSPSAGHFGNGSDWGSPPADDGMRHRDASDGDGTPTLGPVLSASFSNIATSQQLMDVINFVADMKDSVRRAQESDTILLRALQDRIEDQERRYEERISVLEARLAGEERTHEILREEQQEQVETLTTAFEELKSSMEAAVQDRCSVLESGMSNHQLSLQTFAVSAEGVEERLAAAEASLVTLQRNQTRDEMKLHSLTEGVERDRSLMTALKDETIHERKEQLEQIIRSASTQLEFSEKQMARLQEATHAAQEDMDRAVGQRMEHAEERLRDHVLDLMGSSRDTLQAQIETSMKRMIVLGEEVAEEAKATRRNADDALKGLRDEYRTEVDATLADVVQRAKQLETERRAEFPVADVDRVNLMIQELEGAAAILEGFAKNTVLLQASASGGGGANVSHAAVAKRVEALEEAIHTLYTKLEDEIASAPLRRAMFSVDVQTGPLGRDNGPSWSDEDRVRRSVERHLRSELEVAAADHSATKTRTETALTLLAAASNSRTTSAYPNTAPHLASPSPPRSATPVGSGSGGTWSRGASPRAGGVSYHSDLQQMPLTNAPATVQTHDIHHHRTTSSSQAKSHSRLLAEVVAERQKKEQTVDKIQQILREIQSKFHELSVREPLQRSLHTNMVDGGGGSSTFVLTPRSTTHTSDQILKQKEAIFQKERVLVEQRNKLWREIGLLEEQEEQLHQQYAFTG